MSKEEVMISAIAVCDNKYKILSSFIDEISSFLEGKYTNFELILVDNGSIDGTEKIVLEILKQKSSVRYLRLTRPTDYETALMAGLDASIGDFVVSIDPDFDPVGEVSRLVDTCRSGADLALGQDIRRSHKGLMYRTLRAIFRYASGWLFGVKLAEGTTGFRAISRHGVNALVKVRHRRRYFPLVISDIGLIYSVQKYNRISRSGKYPEFDFIKAIRIGASVLIHNSITPLRMASGLGLIGSLLSVVYSLYAITVFLLKSDVAPGWTTLSLAVSLLFALAFLILALIGEYLGRLLEESGEKPLYHLRDELSSSIMLNCREKPNVLDNSEDNLNLEKP